MAQTILEKLLTGADFEDLAIQHSEHSLSASKGGSIGWIRENQLSQSFNVDTKNLRQGIVNKLIESQFGLHILKVDDIKIVDISQEKIKQKAFKILKDRKYAENLAKSDNIRKTLKIMLDIFWIHFLINLFKKSFKALGSNPISYVLKKNQGPYQITRAPD